MARFRKKPVVVDAFRFYRSKRDLWPDWARDGVQYSVGEDDCDAIIGWFVTEIGGSRIALEDGDWIIRGVKGELYPCKPDIFEETYEEVEE